MVDRSLDGLVGLAYDAAVDPALWSAFLSRLKAETHAVGAFLVAHDLERPKSGSMQVSGLERRLIDLYFERYAADSIWVNAVRDLPAGSVFQFGDYVADSDLKRTEFFDTILRPQDVLHGTGCVLALTTRWQIGLSTFHAPRQGRPSARMMARFGGAARHVRRAMQLATRLDHARTLEQAIEAAGRALFVVDGEARILFASRTAEALLLRGEDVKSERGALHCSAPRDTKRLHEGVCAAIARGHGGGLKLALLKVFISPAPSRLIAPGVSQRTALVFVDPQGAAEPCLIERHGLTPTEARVAGLIAEGKGIVAAANALGVSVNTVRTHLARVFAKTGTHRQAELVALLKRR